MLNPQSRSHLFETLRPPEGYQLDRAIGTTFSLNLMALLTIPLAFTFFGSEDEEGRPMQDPLALLDGLRRYANRLSIFCQAGQIGIPKASQLLFGYLEDSVFEVTPPPRSGRASSSGIFHPKVWLLRYIPANTRASLPDAQPIRYRFLCSSRNLTFDRSWDTVLLLDGVLTTRNNAFARNHPLGDFIATLPKLAVRPVSETAMSSVALLQDEVRRVEFQLPHNFESFDFYPIGLGQRQNWPFGKWKNRLLVVSPFLTSGFLRRISQNCENNILVSRLDGVERMTRAELSDFQKIYVLSPEADIEAQGETDEVIHQIPSKPEFNPPLSGLHAKLFIIERGWDALVWTGSANATGTAIKHNVEFLVRLKGKKSKVGIDKFLSFDKNRINFTDLLQEYTPSDEPGDVDEVQERLDEKITQTRRCLSQANLRAVVMAGSNTDNHGNDYQINLTIMKRETILHLSDVEVRCWPITRREEDAVPLNHKSTLLALLGPISFEALTSFFAFEIKGSEGERVSSTRFVLNIPLENAPADRRERILRHLLQNKQQVMRYLLFLLAEGGGSYEVIDAVARGTSGNIGGDGGLGLPVNLFEALVRALERNPSKLDQITRLVDDLKQTDDGLSLLPDNFFDIWQPIWEARLRLSNKQQTDDKVDLVPANQAAFSHKSSDRLREGESEFKCQVS